MSDHYHWYLEEYSEIALTVMLPSRFFLESYQSHLKIALGFPAIKTVRKTIRYFCF